jgi:flagellar biosynthesis protein FlhB
MALFRDDQGKTEKPTPNRLAEVREKGDTRMSRELLGAGVLLVAVVAMRTFGPWLLDAFEEAMSQCLRVDPARHPSRTADIPGVLNELVAVLAIVAPPFLALLGLLVVATLLFGFGQIGLRFSTEVLGFKIERLNPFTNWSRIFNFQAIVRTAFSAVKLLVLVAVVWFVLHDRWAELSLLHEVDFPRAVAEVADMALQVFFWVAAVVLVLSLVDFVYQRFDFIQRNMMTKQEVEDERRRSEGDPLIKNRMRQARNELLRHRMMEAVPKADVVITNPTHFSVALHYDRGKNTAPAVVAKGMDAMALRIRELAQEHDVPIMEDAPLARALFRAVKVGQEVPEKFYQAVAAVLSHVYRLRGKVA